MDKRIFTGGLDRDSDERIIQNGDYRYALNIRNTSSDSDDVGTIQNSEGNLLVSYALPTGTNRVIGSCHHSSDSTVYYFVWNSQAKHSILEYNGMTHAITKVLENEILGFSRENLITHSKVIKLASKDVDSIDLTESQKLLYFTDNLNEPRKINIQKAILHSAGDYVNGYSERLNDGTIGINTTNLIAERDIYIDVIKHAPRTKPTASIETDKSRDSNNIRGKLYQFKYRYIYDDNERSAWSPISNVVITNYDRYHKIFGTARAKPR